MISINYFFYSFDFLIYALSVLSNSTTTVLK